MSGDPLNFLTAGSEPGGDDAGGAASTSNVSSEADASMLLSGGGGGGSAGEGDDANTSEGGFVIGGNEKKPLNKTTLILFLAVALGGGGLYLMHLRAGPDPAVAAGNTKEQQAVSTFLKAGPDNMQKLQTLLRNTEQVVNQFLAYPSVKQVPLNALVTNPFREKAPAGNPTDLSEAEARRQRELAKEQVKHELDNLSLQSVMRGRVNSCMISGKLVKEGQTINGFTVEKITASSVIVSQGEFKFELKMER